MAIFFLFVGLEIKREALEGQLTTWSQRILPGIAAFGGMAGPALIYLAFNHSDAGAMRGWAIPTATDIAFALGVLALLGARVPPSLKLFLTALAIIDDLGAVIIIACFYTSGLSIMDFAGAAIVLCGMWLLNRRHVATLWPYLILGVVLWIFVYRSGIHATLAGVAMAMVIPMRSSPATEAEPRRSPLHRRDRSPQPEDAEADHSRSLPASSWTPVAQKHGRSARSQSRHRPSQGAALTTCDPTRLSLF